MNTTKNFKAGDTVRRYYFASGRTSKATYTVVKVEDGRVWITEGALDSPAGMKAYRPTQVIKDS